MRQSIPTSEAAAKALVVEICGDRAASVDRVDRKMFA
jgi:hypothetical protein